MPGRSKIMQTPSRPKKTESSETRVVEEAVAAERGETKAPQNLNRRNGREQNSIPARKRGAGTWMSGFRELAAYKKKHGTVSVTHPDKNRYLSNWIYHQRQDQRKLTKEQRTKLDDIGFDFTLTSEKNAQNWDFKLQLLVEYKNKYKTCLMPSGYFVGQICMGRWSTKQRSQARRGLLDRERFDMLDAIGFVWDLNDPRVEQERDLMAEPQTTTGGREEASVRIVTPDVGARSSAPSTKKRPKSNKRVLDKILSAEETRAKKHKSSNKTPDWILSSKKARDGKHASTVVVVDPKLNRREPMSEKIPSTVSTSTTLDKNSKTHESAAKTPENHNKAVEKVVAAVVEPTRKSSRKRVLSRKLLDDMFIVEGQELSDLEGEEETEPAATTELHAKISREVSIRRVSETEERQPSHWQAPPKQRNHWQEMYDHDHQWHPVPEEFQQSQSPNNAVFDQESSSERQQVPISVNTCYAIHDRYTPWQATDTQDMRLEKQVKKGAGWLAVHAQDTEWKAMYAELVRYVLMHGHCQVRPSTGNKGFFALAEWVSQQRRLKRQNRLGAERKSLLEQIGFIWRAEPGTEAMLRVERYAEQTRATLAPFSPSINLSPRPHYYSPDTDDRACGNCPDESGGLGHSYMTI